MEVSEIRNDLIERIEHADPEQLKELYGLVINYFGSHITSGINEPLTEYQRMKIQKGLEQAEAGLVVPFDEVVKKVRDKHRLNG